MKSKNENQILTTEYLNLHKRILEKKAKVGLALYEFCEALSAMHDSRAYLNGGYESFEDYTVQALEIKKSQAYTYLSLYQNHSQQFFQENGKIGITKLQLLNNLSEEDATKFIQDNNVDNISVKQLKKTIAKYKDNLNTIPEEPEVIDIEPVEENITYSSFAQFLKEHRMQAGLSRKELAAILGISLSHLINTECGKRISNKANFYSLIIKLFNLSEDEIKLMKDLVEDYHFKKHSISSSTKELILTNKKLYDFITTIKDKNIPINTWDEILRLVK